MSERRRTRTASYNPPPTEPAATPRWAEADVRALGVTTDVVTAGQILGLSRNTAYRLARAGTFPVPVIQAGHQYRIPVAGLLAALHLTTTAPPDGDDPHPPAP
ncbi:helix-turn-helix transcriptional regulator [Micromonospora coerulea]|uniref:helix-turn-helix transcriptional regulator n=1 Tax=Micromonospora coerulea TaxID=47856 RepID=UPI001905588C|nr:helix-turn-helix domain-containing protein [Micromonospora veneta]